MPMLMFSICWGGDDGGVKSVLALRNKNFVGSSIPCLEDASPH